MEATWTVPKNIRQIGEANGHYAIYIEDYVSTYIKQVVRLSDGGVRQGVLVGKVYPDDGKTIFVIQGIVTDKELYRTRDQLFSEAGREALREQCGQYFAELDRIGEVIFDSEKDDMDIARRGMLLDNTGVRKLLLHVDCADGAQKFYIGSQGAVEAVESYYIFYDRNEAMQNYLIAYNEETRRKVEEVHDIISGQARAAMGEFRVPRARVQRDSILICAACALLICVSLLGIININQYQKMCEMQESFHEVLVSLGLGSDDAVPAASDAASQDGMISGDGMVSQGGEASDGTGGYIVSDITPEDGMAAGDSQEGLFDGLPVYTSDGTGANHEENVSGRDEEANAAGTGDASGQDAEGSSAETGNASGQDVEGSSADAGAAPEENEERNPAGEGTPSGKNEEGNPAGEGTTSGQDEEGNHTGAGNGSEQDAGKQQGGQEETGASDDSSGVRQNDSEGSVLAQGGAGESGMYREYTIKKGDTLTSISMLFYQNKSMIGQICALNGIENADNIVAGQKILLP